MYEIGYGKNVVNVVFVDLCGWDMMGEFLVFVFVVIGVVFFVFVMYCVDLFVVIKNLLRVMCKVVCSCLFVEIIDGICF